MRHALTALLLVPCCALAQPASIGTGTLIEKVSGVINNRDIEGLLTKSSAGSVSAAGLAGVDPDSLSVIENVRDFSVLIKAFDSDAKGFGVAIAPARTKTPFPRITLQEYSEPRAYLTRLLGNLTISYAQGKTKEAGTDYTKRAISVATSAFWAAEDDPVVAVARAQECSAAALAKLPDVAPLPQTELERTDELQEIEAAAARGDTKAQAAIDAIIAAARNGDRQALGEMATLEEAALRRRARAGDAQATRELRELLIARAQAGRFDDAAATAALKAFNSCADRVLRKLDARWNRTRYSLSLATGAIKASDGGGGSTSLGQTAAFSVLYGFDGVRALQDRAALTLTGRFARDEPVLRTLASGNVRQIDTTLLAVRLSGGSSVFRGLVEASNADSTDITSTQRTFRRALGIDYRVLDGLWLNLRYGKQKRLDGGGDETASFLVLNYSPAATLGR